MTREDRMPTTFKTNPVSLSELLKECGKGEIQLPDFQRSWVWDDDRIQSLIASISQAFPVGALMTLKSGGDVNFHPRLLQGAPGGVGTPTSLLLDGQQRMTSLYQALVRREVIRTRNAKGLAVNRFYYLDMQRALDPAVAREDAIVAFDSDKTIKGSFGKIETDVSTEELEFDQLMFPLNRVFDKAKWQTSFWRHWMKRERLDEMEALWQRFDDEILANFETYLVPVIELGSGTTREAICLVFEKVNTGGKPLDAFELVTAIYAADGFRLRDDWSARERRLYTHPVLKSIGAIDFLQAASLLHSARTRADRLAAGDTDPPAISATRASLLRLPLHAYKHYADTVEQGFVLAAKFLRRQRIYRVLDLPYRSQLVPLAATLAQSPGILEHAARFDRLSRWYWCGVFGELYGGATETRMAKDYAEVASWTTGEGAEPTTVTDASFRSDRLASMTSRLSAAYKGINARLMDVGALDFRSGQPFEQTMFFDESVDIHHIFPRAWCVKQGIKPAVFNSIVNKTPLSAKTNRILGGTAPSAYLGRLEKGGALAPPIPIDQLERYLLTHQIGGASLRADDFAGFMQERREALIGLVEQAMGKSVYRDQTEESVAAIDDGEEEAIDAEAIAA